LEILELCSSVKGGLAAGPGSGYHLGKGRNMLLRNNFASKLSMRQ